MTSWGHTVVQSVQPLQRSWLMKIVPFAIPASVLTKKLLVLKLKTGRMPFAPAVYDSSYSAPSAPISAGDHFSGGKLS
jgi:hypothetical protein